MIDWLDLLAVQGTLKSLLQHHSSKVSILQHSTFFFFWCPFLFTCSYPRLSSLQSFKLFISKLLLHLLLHPYFLYIRTSAPGALFKIVPVGRTGTFHIFWDHPWVYCAFLMHTHMHSFNVYSLLLPPSVFPSIRVFSNESVLHIR